MQTGKVRKFPVVLMGRDYWGPMIDFLKDRMVEAGTISANDPDHLVLTDDPEEATSIISETARKRFGLTYGPRAEPRRLLLEQAIFGRR